MHGQQQLMLAMSTNLKLLLAPLFHTILHYMEDHPHSINSMFSMSYTIYHLLPIYDQGSNGCQIETFLLFDNIMQTMNCKHAAHQQSFRSLYHHDEMSPA